MRPLLFALLVAACSSSPKSGGGDMAGAGGSGGGGDLAAAPPDLQPRSTAGIACGATACNTTSQLCCTADTGKTGVCQQVQNPSCGTAEFLCDGPEDCEPANPDCCVQGGRGACRPPGYCAMQTNASFMCHVDSDCGAIGKCCRAPNGSPYALCLAACP